MKNVEKINKLIIIFLLMLVCTLCGCEKEENTHIENSSETMSPYFSNDIYEYSLVEKINTQRGDVSNDVDLGIIDSGDGWYITEDGILYISKIYYTVMDVVGNARCVYQEPWVSYRNAGQIRSIVIDADMVYTDTSPITGEKYKDLSENYDKFQGGGALFGDIDSLTTLIIKRLDFDKITDISTMFWNNDNLVYVDASGLDLYGIRDASYLFYGNSKLVELDLSHVNTLTLTDIEKMFAGCVNLNRIAVTMWNTRGVKNFRHVFSGCESLGSINLGNWTIDDNADAAGMFANCKSLSSLQLSDVKMSSFPFAMFDENNSLSSYIFADGWNIAVENPKHLNPIGEKCYYSTYIFDITTGIYVEFVYYNKQVPKWYKEWVEEFPTLEGCTQIVASDYLDIYCNRENGEMSASDVVEVALESLKSQEAIDDNQSTIINNTVKKFEILSNWSQGDYSVEDIVDITEMTIEEIEILANNE